MSRALDGFQAYKYNKEKKAKKQGKSTEVTKIYDSDLPESQTQNQNTSPLDAFKRERGLGTLTDAGRAAYANRAVKANPLGGAPQDNPYMKAAVRQMLPAYQRPVDPITVAAANMLRNNARGNIDLYNRPEYRQPDGSISTVNSISIGDENGKEILIPTIGRDAQGRPVQWTDDQAIDHYYKTGENLGKFNTVEEANDYAEKLHRQQEAYYSPENSPLRLNNVIPRPYEIGGAVRRFQQTGEMNITPELKKMMDEAPESGQGLRSSTQEEVDAAADWTAQRVANAEQQQRVREMRTFDRHNPVIASALQGTGLPSMLTAGEQALARLTGNEEAQKQSAQIYADELREAQGLQARHPLAYNVGNVVGNIATVVGIGKVIGAIPAFANMSNLAQAVVSGAGAMGGTTAIQEAGAASTGMISPKDYALDIATGAGVGAAGGAVSSQIAGAGMNFLRNHGLAGNALAQTVVAGLSSSGYSGAGTAVRQGSAYLRDPENYQFDAEQAAKDAAVAFAFGAFSFAWRNRQNFTMNQEDPNQRPSTKYFDDCKTPGEIDSKLRQYARQYHPDQPNGNADLFAEISAEATAMKAWMNVNNGAQAYQRAQEAYSSGDTAEYQAAQQEYNAAVNALMVDVQSGAIQGNEAVEALQILQSVSANLAGPEAQAPATSGSEALAALAQQAITSSEQPLLTAPIAEGQPPTTAGALPTTAPTTAGALPTTAPTTAGALPTTAPSTVAQPSTTGAEMFPQAQNIPGNPYEMTAAQKLDTAARQLQALEYERNQHPSVEQLNDELNSPFAVFENENPEIAQIQTRTGEQKLAALAAQATENQAAQKRDQIQAIYEAGKTQNPDFQTVMDSATMLTETEKTDAFYRGLTAAAAEAAGVGKEISYGGQQEEGNYLSGEGSGRDLSLRAGERDGGVPSEAGSVAEGWQNWTAAADPGLRGGDEGDGSSNVTLDRGVLAEKVLRTAAPGQVVYPVKDGGTAETRKGQAMMTAYDPKMKQTLFVSKGDILTDKGEYSRAFADPVTRQIGIRINDEQAPTSKTSKHEILEMADMDGKIDRTEAEDLARHIIHPTFFKEIVKAYQNNGPKKIGIKHAIKEALFDIGAGINQFEGVENYEDLARAIDLVHPILHDYFNDVLGGVFDAEYDETAAPAVNAKTAAGTSAEATAPSRIVGESPKVEITDKNVSVDSIVPTITEMPKNLPEYSSTLYKEPAQKELITLTKGGEIKVKEKLNMSGRDFLIRQMKEKGYKDKKHTLYMLDKTAELMDKAGAVYKYIGMDDINNVRLVIDPRSGNIVLRALVKNGEYPVNLDLTKECTRRIALGNFIKYLAEHEGRHGGKTMLEEVPLTAKNLVRFNQILKDEGFDTACLGCFVETRRYRIQEWADSFIEKYNRAVEKYNPDAGYYDFSDKDIYVSDMSKQELSELNEALESYKTNQQADVKAKRERLGQPKTNLTNEESIDALVRSGKAYQKKLRVSDLITPDGRTALHRDLPELESLVLGHYGSNTPKSVELFTPYNYDLGSILSVGNQSLQDYVKPIGGVREQSFSDSVPTHLMDQMEKTADLAVNKLVDHTYTKVPSEVMMLGLTGRKFNMSIMFNIDPDVDSAHAGLRADGSYFIGDRKTSELEAKAGRERTFVQSFPYDMARKIQHTPGYSKNCGMIGVGYSYFHMRKMMDDPEFGQIIGYHPSGMNESLANMAHIDKATSYEPVQNTLRIKGLRQVTGDLNGLPSYASWPIGTKTSDNKMVKKTNITMKDFDMKGKLAKYGGPKTMKMFLSWLEENRLTVDTGKGVYKGNEQHGVGDFPLYADLAKTRNPKKTADNYITWCLENDMLPEFYEFADHDNYFKNLYDFTTYDHRTMKYSPQVPVTMTFPPNFFRLANHSLNQWNNYMMRQEPKAIPTFEKMYDEAVRYSSRLNLSGKMDSAGTELTTKQEEYFKDSKIRDEEGNLLRVYHGTYEDFNVFDKNKGRSTMDIQGSFFTPWDIDAEGYGPNVKTVYLNIKNPAPERVAYKALNMFKGQNNAGTKAREYLISKGYDGVNNNNEEYIAFYPEQIKNIDNQNPTSSEDIRYSSKLNLKASKERDKEYDAAVKSNDMTAAGRMVRDAAKSIETIAKDSRGNPVHLYHGTPRFGFTKFQDPKHKTPFIYTSTKSEVSAHYAGDDHYAAKRPIGTKYRDGNDVNDIIENAKNVYGVNYRLMTVDEKEQKYKEIRDQAAKVADKLDELFPDNLNVSEQLANDLQWATLPFWELRDYDDQYNFREDDGYRDEWKQILEGDIEHYEESRNRVKEYYDENYSNLEGGVKKYLRYLLGYEAGDTAIDIKYGMMRLMTDGDVLVDNSGRTASPQALKENMDQTNKIGAYDLYGDLGDNPYEIDTNGSQFWAIKVPDMGDGYYSTDELSKWALQNGYTSVIMRNIYDYGDKADNYVFFNSSQLKSADPVTYDDNGNVIPLSERFNTENQDIRYSSKLQLNKDEDDANLYYTMRSALSDKGDGWEFYKIDNEYDLVSPSGDEAQFSSVRDAAEYYIKQTGDDSVQKRIDAMAEFKKRAKKYEKPVADKTKDSSGRKVSKPMQEYMKNSRMRTAEGQLKPMFHGTETAGFTIFDSGTSDDKLSLFFSDDPYVSESYIEGDVFGFTKDAPVKDVETFADRVSYFTEYEWEVSEDGLSITDDNGDVHEFNTPEETRDYFVDHYDTSGVYEVYLNITNPLELDAKGAMWNNLPSEYNGKKIDGTDTRAWAAFAYENGYDGVIFRNIVDNGGNGLDDYRESTVAVAFNSNQVKSVHNQNPTENDDIRYSSKLKLRDKENDYAPTFYSKLQREIQNYKGEKIGAASVESYLKGKGVKDEEIKWSGIRTFLEGKKSVNKQELMQYLRDNEMEISVETLGNGLPYFDSDQNRYYTDEDILAAAQKAAEEAGYDPKNVTLDHGGYGVYGVVGDEVVFEVSKPDPWDMGDAGYDENGTRWSEYKLDGGENYREILFKIPNSNYSNNAMNTHWGDTGVLAHARVQDFETEDGGKVLFVEEIQSDWHNAGQKHGYSNDFNVVEGEYGQWLLKDANGKTVAKTDQLYTKERAKEALMNQVRNKVAPDAPFRTTYTDYVLKNLLRMAAEGDYDYLAWTTGKMQEERWSDQYAEGYRIEYDQQIPKFLKKYGKQWKAGLTEISLSAGGIIGAHGPEVQELFNIVKDYDPDTSYSDVENGAGYLEDNLIDLINESDERYEKAIELARSLDDAYHDGTLYSSPVVPAITVNDAMKNSVLTEGQPMYSTKLNLNGREVELTDREEELMDQLNSSYLDRIDEITQQKDAEIAALQKEMERAVGEEKKKARDRLERLRKQKNDRIAYLEKQWRENTNRRIADLKEKAKNKLGEQHDDMIRRLAKLQAQKDKKIEDILAEHRRQRQEARDKRNDHKLRVKFQKLAQRAVRDSKNKPGMASQRVQELLKDIDLKALGMRDETKWELRRKYQEILEMKEKDENYAALFADRDMKKVERLFKTQINEMSVEDINDLITELSALAHYQENTDRLLKDSQGRSAAEVGRQIVKDLKELSPLEVTNPVKRLSAKYLRDNLSPERAFNRLSGYKHDNAMKTFYRTQVLDGLTKVKRFEQKADELKQEFINDEKNKYFLNNGSKQTIPVTDKYGRAAMISPAMRVSLYMASKNTDNLRHIATDGVTVPEPKTYAKGMIEDAYGRGTTLILDPTDVKAICNGMTDSEKEFATLLKIFFDTYAKDAINETSVDLDGILKATVENYFPITSDKNFLAKSMDSFQDPTLEGWNNLKSRQEGANNKILLEDARQVLQRHIRNTARYHGLAVPMRNWGKVYGYTSHRDEATGTRNSVQSAIKNAWDADTADYIERLIRDDINSGGRKAERGIADAMRSAYAGATLTLNPSVALKQTTSYLMAGSILDSGSLMYGLAHGFTKKDEAYMDSITPWGWARRQGESTIELGDLARKMDPITKNTPNWNQAMDVWTTNRLFLATEESVKKEFKASKNEALHDLKRGDKKYDDAVAERYNQVLWRTQPQYEAAFRPEYLRKTDVGSRTFGMFKTESMQMSGELIDSWGQWKADSMRTKDAKNIYDKHPGDQTKSEYETNDRYRKESAKQFYRTFTSWVASNMLFAIMGTALNIGLLHKGKPYRNEKGEIDWETIAKKTALNFVGSSLGGFFYASTAADIGAYLYGKLSGENPTWYDIEVPGISLMNDAVENMGNLTGVLTNEEANNAAKAQAIAKFALAVSKFTPVGFAENIVNLANSVVLYNQDVKEGTFGKWEAGKGLLKDTSPTKDQYANRAVYAARKGDMATAERALKKTKKANLEKAVGRPITENMYKKIMEDPNNLRNYLGVALEDMTPSIKNVPDHGYSSFTKLREDIGDPERTQNWHHIVEQEQMEEGLAGFKSTQVNNTNNIVSIPSGSKSPHSKISEYYGSVQDFTDGKTVREWLKDKSFEEQWEFGVKQLREYGDLVPTTNGWVFVPDKKKMETKIPMEEGKAKEKTDTQRSWESRIAEAREDGSLKDNEIRTIALDMIREGISAEEAEALYRDKKKKEVEKLDKWIEEKGTFEDYLKGRNAISEAAAIKDKDKEKQAEKKKKAVEDYLRQYHGSYANELWLWELAGYSENTFEYH